MTQLKEIKEFALELKTGASVSYSHHHAQGFAAYWGEVASQVRLFKENGMGQAMPEAEGLALSIQLLFQSGAFKNESLSESYIDFLLKSASVMLQKYFEMIYKNQSHENETIVSGWKERLLAFQQRIESKRLGSNGEKIQINIEDNLESAKLKILEQMSDELKVPGKNVVSMNVIKLERDQNASHTFPIVNEVQEKNFFNNKPSLSIFRLAGRRYAVPASSVKGTGRVEGLNWMVRSVNFQQRQIPLRDARKVLGVAGEAGGVYLVLMSQKGTVEAWAVDGVEPGMSSNSQNHTTLFHLDVNPLLDGGARVFQRSLKSASKCV